VARDQPDPLRDGHPHPPDQIVKVTGIDRPVPAGHRDQRDQIRATSSACTRRSRAQAGACPPTSAGGSRDRSHPRPRSAHPGRPAGASRAGCRVEEDHDGLGAPWFRGPHAIDRRDLRRRPSGSRTPAAPPAHWNRRGSGPGSRKPGFVLWRLVNPCVDAVFGGAPCWDGDPACACHAGGWSRRNPYN
jgi:hypothetical protein